MTDRYVASEAWDTEAIAAPASCQTISESCLVDPEEPIQVEPAWLLPPESQSVIDVEDAWLGDPPPPTTVPEPAVSVIDVDDLWLTQ